MKKLSFLKQIRRNEDGSIATETALIMTVLSFMAVGVLDFGLAYTHNLQLANAARAGMQYAMVRKPIDGDYSAIISAVNTAAPTVDDGNARNITASMFCSCPDGTSINCTGTGGEDLTCPDGSLRGSYLQITIAEDYDMFMSYPGIDDTLALSESVTVRLN